MSDFSRRDWFSFAGRGLAAGTWAAVPLGADPQSTPVPIRTGKVLESDVRLNVRTLNSPVPLPSFTSRAAWEGRARWLRLQILCAGGLWPMPERTPLHAEIFGRVEREGYSLERVYFQSFPGFYCTGNLYRPAGSSNERRPAVLNPHGHWNYGRLEHNRADVAAGVEVCSVPQRCMNFALQGYVAFAYDMVGYNDSFQVAHHYTYDERAPWALTQAGVRYGLWGASILGLQLWNSIRALDFISELPDVDRSRIAVTGASGGGTQTFLLTAVDDRVHVSAPVNMISHFMQGGDVCENAPNLRIDTNNVEIGAMMAPRPMLMVSASGDWTTDTPRVEYPAIRAIYSLWNAAEHVEQQHFDFPHNYNRTSREAVYTFFSKWLARDPDAVKTTKVEERGEFDLDPGQTLVFARRQSPTPALTTEQVFESLIDRSRKQIVSAMPHDEKGLAEYREKFNPVYSAALMASWPASEDLSWTTDNSRGEPQRSWSSIVASRGAGDRVPCLIAGSTRRPWAAVVVHPNGSSAAVDSELVRGLLPRSAICAIDTFQTGRALNPERKQEGRFFSTYNRTDDSNRVQDVLTAIAWVMAAWRPKRIGLIGIGTAGLWCLLARPFLPRRVRLAVIADADMFHSNDDDAYLSKLHVPLLRRAGDFISAAWLASPEPLLLHNTAGFDTEAFRQAYALQDATARLKISEPPARTDEILRWLTNLPND